MIVPMKYLTLLCVKKEHETALEELRKAGCVHLELKSSDSQQFRNASARQELVSRAIATIEKAADPKGLLIAQNKNADPERMTEELLKAPLDGSSLQKGSALDRAKAVRDFSDEMDSCLALLNLAKTEHDRYFPFGNFDLSLPDQLAQKGLTVRLFTLPFNETLPEDGDGFFKILSQDEKMKYGVQIGGEMLPENCTTVPFPPKSPDAYGHLMGLAENRAKEIRTLLGNQKDSLDTLKAELKKQEECVTFVIAMDSMGSNEEIAWITGWVPAPKSEEIRELAKKNAWGALMRDPEPDEFPPTLLEPPKIFKPVLSLFQALGIAPAYSEADVSVPFFAFFSIFFAMLVGDGGYGAVILALTIFARYKMPKAPRSPFILMTVFSIATIIWGILSNSWFGTSPKFMSNAVSDWLADPSYKNWMLLCFSLGVIHLMIARVWNAICLFPDTKGLAEFGWAGIVAFMFTITCSVVGIFPCPTFMYWVLGVSIVLVFGFSLKRSELKEHGVELGMLPLNIAGALGDIISYVRLFAVGLASVKVAQNFNDMAINLGLPIWAKIIPMILILLIGHGLNFAMAGLSILVHAVRLNTLEFSNHKGISWSGYAFHPFKRNTSNL